MLAVTTFSPQGYIDYGKLCIETLDKFWPGRIVAYVEELTVLPDRVDTRLFHDIPGWKEWFDRASKHAGSNGQSHSGYDYRYDALKFCRKVFAQEDVFDEEQFVWWIDADCIIRQKIDESLMKRLLEDWAVAYLGRNGPQTYTETGVIGFNTSHPEFHRFRENYMSWITSGKIFSQLKGWHDCIAFDHARQGITSNNLTPRGEAMNNVIIDSPLGKYISHRKGPRKFSAKHLRDALAV